MIAYIFRRFLYAIPILIGVNLITFGLFFVVNTPEDMARMQLGAKARDAGCDREVEGRARLRPALLWNGAKAGVGAHRDDLFQKSAKLFAFDFGNADDGRRIGHEIRHRGCGRARAGDPSFLVGLARCTSRSRLMLAFLTAATSLDFWGVVLCGR